MAFCPGCGYEFREGVKQCPDCDLALVADLEDAELRRAGLRRGGKTVSVWRAERARVEMLADLLDQEGIESVVRIAPDPGDPARLPADRSGCDAPADAPAGDQLAELHVPERDARAHAELIRELIAQLPEAG